MSHFAELGSQLFEGIVVYPNIAYGSDAATRLDIYIPRNLTGVNKTLVAIHGGGWISGTKEEIFPQLIPFLLEGWSVVNVEYRLAEVASAPAAVIDVRCALQWVFEHATDYQFNPEKIVVIGGSAGGHLATLCSILPDAAGLDFSPSQFSPVKVAAIINLFGIMDVNDMLQGVNCKDYAVLWFGKQLNSTTLATQISPLQYIRSGLPPILTIHGNQDQSVPYQHAIKLHEKLQEMAVPNQLLTLENAGHGGFSSEHSRLIYQTIQEFLKQYQLW